MHITKIEGIGSKYGSKLQSQGVKTTEKLLEIAANRKGRQELAEKTEISERMILEWVNRADLMRVRGVGEEYSDLLEAAGVDTVRELRNRNVVNLHKALMSVNQEKKLVRRTPSLSEVDGWVEHAKSLPFVVTY